MSAFTFGLGYGACVMTGLGLWQLGKYLIVRRCERAAREANGERKVL